MSDSVASHFEKAIALYRAGDLSAAAAEYESILARDPDQADAWHLLGVLRDLQGDHVTAIMLIERAIAIKPHDPDFYDNLATALMSAQRLSEAEAAYRRCLALNCRHVGGHYNLANLLRRRGDIAGAQAHFRAALQLKPGHVKARNNLAMLLWEDCGNHRAAAREFEKLLHIAPHWPPGRMNHGLFRLAEGSYALGWSEYEWRWRNPKFLEKDWGGGLPRWDGAPLGGGSLLLWGEQGPGDQILYGTMLQDAQRRSNAHLIVAVEPRLVSLFARSLPKSDFTVVERGSPVDAAAQCPFGSLGGILRLQEADFSGTGRYLVADQGLQREIRNRYRQLAGRRRIVGVSWRSANMAIGSHKSIPVTELLPALSNADVQWISLQYGEVGEDLDFLRHNGVAIHHDPLIDSLLDLDGFAAQIAALDGVITVSNTAVHFAGALGVPCLMLLARGRGRLWYWPQEGGDSRWYSSVRIARQQRPDDWEYPMQAVIATLAEGGP